MNQPRDKGENQHLPQPDADRKAPCSAFGVYKKKKQFAKSTEQQCSRDLFFAAVLSGPANRYLMMFFFN